MNSESDSDKKLDDLEKAAVVSSLTIVIFFVVYWAFQIQTTYELLAFAYDWQGQRKSMMRAIISLLSILRSFVKVST